MKSYKYLFGLAFCGAFMLNGNAFAKTATKANAAKQITISFALKAGDRDISCHDSHILLGADNSPTSIRDARLYISNVRLIDKTGKEYPLNLTQNEWQYMNVALLDFEDATGKCDGNPQTNTSITGTSAVKNIQSIAFDIGVPVSGKDKTGKRVSLNHSNTETSPSPLNIAAMAWNWQGGRKFTKFELAPDEGVKRKNDTIKIWTIHLGSTDCAGNPASDEDLKCSSPNRVEVKLDAFNPQKDKVVFDFKTLYVKAHITKDDYGAAGCMSFAGDPECEPIFAQLGLRLKPSSEEVKDAGTMIVPGVSPFIRKEAK